MNANDLIWYALNKSKVKDIPFWEYNVLIESAVIETCWIQFQLESKLKLIKWSLEKFGKFTNLMSNNFAAIKACLGMICQSTKKFCECILHFDIVSEQIIWIILFLASQLPEYVDIHGRSKVVDDIDLKIELNRYLNMMTKYSYHEDYPSDMILGEYRAI